MGVMAKEENRINPISFTSLDKSWLAVTAFKVGDQVFVEEILEESVDDDILDESPVEDGIQLLTDIHEDYKSKGYTYLRFMMVSRRYSENEHLGICGVRPAKTNEITLYQEKLEVQTANNQRFRERELANERKLYEELKKKFEGHRDEENEKDK